MIYVRLAENAEHPCFSFVCNSVTEAMALTHYYVWRGSARRCAEIVCTDIRFPWPCGIAYTRRGSFADECLNDSAFEYLYDTSLDYQPVAREKDNDVDQAINACVAYSTHYSVGTVFVVASDGTFITSRQSYQFHVKH